MRSLYKVFRNSQARNLVGSLRKAIVREKDDFSQNLEYTRLKALLDELPNKVILDIGAHDGKSYSNSYPLLKRGWKGFLVEPNPVNCELINKNCKGLNYTLVDVAVTPEKQGFVDLYFDSVTIENFRASIKKPDEDEWAKANLSSKSVRVKALTIEQLVNQYNIPLDLGVLSIDIEGIDTKVIQTLGTLRPYLILIEIDFSSFIEAKSKINYLLELGYLNVFRIGCNEGFINTNYDFFGRSNVKIFIENNF